MGLVTAKMPTGLAVLYMLSFPNGKCYLGITSHFSRRMRAHATTAGGKNSLTVGFAIAKYGWDSVLRRILAVGNIEYIKRLEIEAIRAFDTLLPNGYNISVGGDMTFRTPSISNTVSRKLKGRIFSEEHRAKLSAANRARSGGVYAAVAEKLKNPSDETRALMRAAALKRSANPEYLKKISEANKRRPIAFWEKLAITLRNIDPEKREAKRKKLVEKNKDPAFRAKVSEAKKLWWKKKKASEASA